jgi:hypothetical protein
LLELQVLVPQVQGWLGQVQLVQELLEQELLEQPRPKKVL